jgi:hypothetical protein
LFTNQNAQDAANAQIAAQQRGLSLGLGSLNQGLTTANNTYTAGLAPTQANLATDQAGQTAYANATGANGPAGQAQAVKNFQTGPGYQFQLDQGSQNVLRNQAATGQLASGATDTGLLNYGQGQANQAWQQYIQGLQPFMGASTQNAGISATSAANQAGLQNTNYTNQANMNYGANVAQGNAQANADLANNQAAQNIMGAITGGVKLASGLSGFFG